MWKNDQYMCTFPNNGIPKTCLWSDKCEKMINTCAHSQSVVYQRLVYGQISMKKWSLHVHIPKQWYTKDLFMVRKVWKNNHYMCTFPISGIPKTCLRSDKYEKIITTCAHSQTMVYQRLVYGQLSVKKIITTCAHSQTVIYQRFVYDHMCEIMTEKQ